MHASPLLPRFALMVCLCCFWDSSHSQAQSRIKAKWGVTELDSIVSVRTPYRGEPLQNPEGPWLEMFIAPGGYNRFTMMRINLLDLARLKTQNADVKSIEFDIDKFFQRIIKTGFLQFSKAKFQREYAISLPSAPEGSVKHRTYMGFDDLYRERATMEATWFCREQFLYLFFCTTIVVENQAADEEKQQFFSTISIRQR